MFPLAQSPHCLLIPRVGQKLKPADAFERDDAAGGQGLCGVLNREVDLRPADRAGVGLGMEAPVERVGVFAPAVRAHLELAHGRVWPVVGNVEDDGEARAAVGAVGEGVQMTPVVGVEKLGKAGRASSEIGQYGGGFLLPGIALEDLETGEPGGGQVADLACEDDRCRGALSIQARKPLGNRRFRSFRLRHQTGA